MGMQAKNSLTIEKIGGFCMIISGAGLLIRSLITANEYGYSLGWAVWVYSLSLVAIGIAAIVGIPAVGIISSALAAIVDVFWIYLDLSNYGSDPDLTVYYIATITEIAALILMVLLFLRRQPSLQRSLHGLGAVWFLPGILLMGFVIYAIINILHIGMTPQLFSSFVFNILRAAGGFLIFFNEKASSALPVQQPVQSSEHPHQVAAQAVSPDATVANAPQTEAAPAPQTTAAPTPQTEAAPAPQAATAPTAAMVADVQDTAAQLKQYKELLDLGILTQEEFDNYKKQLLGF